MSAELRDFDLETSTGGSPRDPGEAPRWPWIVGILVAVAVVGAFLFLRRSGVEEPVAETAPTPAATSPARETPVDADLDLGQIPDLQSSDAWLRGLVAQLSNHPELARWFATDELVRTFVVTVDNVAEGVTPRKHLKFLAPEDAFSVHSEGDEQVIDPASYRRYDLLIEVISSVDVEDAAQLYQALLPMFDQAYTELGYPGQGFNRTMGRAIDRLLAVPVVDRPINVSRGVTAWEYSDSDLQELSPVARQFLRLGPQNLRRLQERARAFARAAGVPIGG